jgi:hypothetical protein
MPTICPNCLRPVRTDAKYCGFCGTNLNPTAHEDTMVTVASTQEGKVSMNNPPPQTRFKSNGSKVRRVALIVVIILLCLVLLLAFLTHYWPVFTPYIGAALSLFGPR